MTRHSKLSGVFIGAVAPVTLIAALLAASSASGQEEVFETPGVFMVTVPPDACQASVEALGASGGDGTNQLGNNGGFASATFPVTPLEVLQITVGSQGKNAVMGTGGGASDFGGGGAGGNDASTDGTNDQAGGGGGGASDVRQGGTGFANRVVVAGGGGGGAGGSNTNGTTTGGAGGGAEGDDGQTTGFAGVGEGGTDIGGGAAGGGGTGGTGGAQGLGGTGSTNNLSNGGGGGGGGGGLFGGGGGGVADGSAGGGGGGGSGLAPNGTLLTGAAPIGDGAVGILFSCPEPAAAPTVSSTGLLVLVILLAIGGMTVLGRRRVN